MALVQFRAPALPLPKQTYDFGQMNELVRALRIYFNQLDSLTPNQAQSYRADAFFGGEFTGNRVEGGILSGYGAGLEVPHAMLMSDQDQGSAGVTSENIVTLNRIILGTGVTVEDNSKIRFATSGQYLVTARFQFANRGNANQEFEIWAKNNGVNYPLSNTRFDIPARKTGSIWSHVTANISGIFTATSGEYLQFAWWSDGADIYIEHYAAGTSPARPEIASAIVTITFISALPARFAPVLGGSLTITGAAPIVIAGGFPAPTSGSLAIQGVAPTVTIA